MAYVGQLSSQLNSGDLRQIVASKKTQLAFLTPWSGITYSCFQTTCFYCVGSVGTAGLSIGKMPQSGNVSRNTLSRQVVSNH
jgi:hypothetical protein